MNSLSIYGGIPPRWRAQPLREQVAAASRRLAAEGLVLGTAGNVSAGPASGAITPTGADLADLEAGDVTVVALDGAVVEGTLAPTSEIDLHQGVYRRYDAGAVVHPRADGACAVVRPDDELPCVHSDAGVRRRRAGRPTARSARPSWPEAVVAALEGKTAALMANHGAIAPGPRTWTRPSRRRCSWSGRAASTGGRPRSAPRAERRAAAGGGQGRPRGAPTEPRNELEDG